MRGNPRAGDETIRQRLYVTGQKNGSLFNHLVNPDADGYPKLYHVLLHQILE